jgi:hypothetical protein
MSKIILFSAFFVLSLFSISSPAQSVEDEIAKSQRLSEIYQEAANFYAQQVEEFYLPELRKSGVLMWAQRGAAGGVTPICAIFMPCAVAISFGASGVAGYYVYNTKDI